MKNRRFAFIFFLLIVIRIYLFIFPSFNIDMSAWQAWIARLYDLGPINFYSNNVWTNYTPGYLFFLWILGLISHNIFNIPFFSLIFEYLIKFTTTIFDLLTAIIIFKILKKYKNKSWALLGFLLYFGNISLIFNTSVWGQIDGILAFFMFFSSYLFLERKKYLSSSLALTQSFILKPQAISLFPIYAVMLLKKIKLKKILEFFVAGLGLLLIYSLLFFPHDILLGLLNLVLKMAKDYSYTSLYAFNLWSIIGWWQTDSLTFFGFSYSFWGTIIFCIALLLIIYPLIKKRKIENLDLYFASALSLMAFFLFPTRVHERYLIPFFAFYLTSAGIKKSKVMLGFYIIISIIEFINQWFVYYYYQFVYNNHGFTQNIFYLTIANFYKFFSAIELIIFFSSIFIYYRLMFYAKKK